jgi:hypothetical protein
MVQEYDHLILPKVTEGFERRKKGRGGGYKEAKTEIFTLALKFKDDFENKKISPGLNDTFAEKGHPLSDISRIKVSGKKKESGEEHEWRILDDKKEYIIRKKRKELKVFKKRDKNEFLTAQLRKSGNIQKAFVKQKKKYEKYFDPNLIFKIDVNQNVLEENFQKELGRMDIKVISPSPDNKGFWIVFAEDEELKKFKKKLEDHAQHGKYAFFNAVEGIIEIPPEEKIGELLRENPFGENESSYLDVEIWRMEDSNLEKFKKGFRSLVESRNGRICDAFLTKNFFLLRIRTNKQLLDDVLELREVSHVDRPPRITIESALTVDREELEPGESPPENATGILVVDSGIFPGHPLLENAVGEYFAVPTRYSDKVDEDAPFDDVGHGTQVAGIALYGDIQQCIKNRVFNPEVWIFSAKVMFRNDFGEAEYDPEELLEHQLYKAVRKIAGDYPRCKVINLSLGNSALRMIKGERQFRLAALVDDLSKELNLIFVISAGNFKEYNALSDSYPDYLLNEEIVKIVDPATSALAISVGALSKTYRPNVLFEVDYPSPLTRVGPGYKGMIKPELVENGGGGFDEKLNVITINHDWIRDGRLFTLVEGTSFSAPKVSNHLARLINKYPDKSLNMIKALLLSSAMIPPERPSPLDNVELGSIATPEELSSLLNIYGYGKPSIERALFSESNRVLLIRESIIKSDQCHFYSIYLPEEFLEMKGNRTISVILVFNPPTNRNRIDYFGVSMKTNLIKNMAIEDVVNAYRNVSEEGNEIEKAPNKIGNNEIKLHPGVNLRKKSVHQKGIRKFKRKPKINRDNPLVLVVTCQKRWVTDNYEQSYAVIVSIKHSRGIDLYNQIRLRNKEKVTISLRE